MSHTLNMPLQTVMSVIQEPFFLWAEKAECPQPDEWEAEEAPLQAENSMCQALIISQSCHQWQQSQGIVHLERDTKDFRACWILSATPAAWQVTLNQTVWTCSTLQMWALVGLTRTHQQTQVSVLTEEF